MQWICTAQRWLLDSMDENSYDHFQYAIDNPLYGDKRWMKKLEELVYAVPPGLNCVVWVYLFERMNYR
jgi:hypothetical protein